MAYDVAVIGLGATGSAALYRLASRKARVVGIEQFEPAHDRGSSHGRTRIIRLGYFEHPSYVPLVRHAYSLWRELEKASGQKLLTVTGIAEIGAPDSELVAGTLASSRQHGLPHTVLDAKDVMRKIQAFVLPPDFVGVMQPDAGVLEVEPAIRAHLALARDTGAEMRTGETVRAVEPQGGGVRIVTDRGTIEAGTAIVAAGGWASSILPDLPVNLRATRQAILWLKPRQPDLFAPARFPLFMLDSGRGILYGFPARGADGVKVAKHHHEDETVDPSTYNRSVTPRDEALIRDMLAKYLPAADGPVVSSQTCLYTMTPDGDFVLDRIPGREKIILASPCSGHGFKFAPAIGEILADLALRGQTGHDISRFRLARF